MGQVEARQAAAKRVIDLVQVVKNYIQAKAESKPNDFSINVIDLSNGEYRVGRVIVKHLGGRDYIVGDGVKVKAFRNGNYRIWEDLYFDSQGNQIEKPSE